MVQPAASAGDDFRGNQLVHGPVPRRISAQTPTASGTSQRRAAHFLELEGFQHLDHGAEFNVVLTPIRVCPIKALASGDHCTGAPISVEMTEACAD